LYTYTKVNRNDIFCMEADYAEQKNKTKIRKFKPTIDCMYSWFLGEKKTKIH